MVSEPILIIAGGAVATYLTRIGGHLILSRFRTIHPRVEAGLDAVPAAVLSTLVAPQLFQGGPAEIAALAVTAVAALRLGMLGIFIAGAGTLVVLRYLIGS